MGRPKLESNKGTCSNGCNKTIVCRGVCHNCYRKIHYEEHERNRRGAKKTPLLPIGHKSIDKDGYVRIKIGKGRQWRDEHILVMEQILGRKLNSTFENVHHKNAIKHDNRKENLELWISKQPSGARASDLIEYANWILKTYVPLQNIVG